MPDKKLILRLESSLEPGRGVYQCSWYSGTYASLRTDLLESYRDRGERHPQDFVDPVPEKDGLENWHDVGTIPVFGFKDPDQLHHWFNHKDCRNVDLCLYQVPDDAIFYGGHQVVFDRNRSVCVLRARMDKNKE